MGEFGGEVIGRRTNSGGCGEAPVLDVGTSRVKHQHYKSDDNRSDDDSPLYESYKAGELFFHVHLLRSLLVQSKIPCTTFAENIPRPWMTA
jgi:hypothetical protein